MKAQGPPPLFICGAGISVAAPASLPGTADIVNAALGFLLPANTRYRKLASSIQPEVLFEQAKALIKSPIHEIWDVLRTDYSKPNIYHYLLVLLASRHRVPIITLNFDTLLEKAAADLGLGAPQVYIPRANLDELLTATEVPLGKCRIWKIHGCIETLDVFRKRSLQTTMSQIARPNEELLKALQLLFAKCKLYIVGYSGRDGDFFPELAQLVRSAPPPSSQLPTWIDPFGFESKRTVYTRLGASIWDRAKILYPTDPTSIANTTDLIAVVENEFPWALDEIHQKVADSDFLLKAAKLSLVLAPRNINFSSHLSDLSVGKTTIEATVQGLCENSTVAELMPESRDALCKLIDCELRRVKHSASIEHVVFSKTPLDPLTKEALLVCMLFHSGYMREAYNYGKSRMKTFETSLPAHLATIVSLYFARICDWNSQYDDFLHFTMVAGKLANEITDPTDRPKQLMAQAGVGCLSTRAKSMLLGPLMNWPNQHFVFPLSLKRMAYLFAISATASFQIRAILAKFERNRIRMLWRVLSPRPPDAGSPETILEELAWQYYLDHRQVFLNNIMRPLIKAINLKPRNLLLAALAVPVKRLAMHVASKALRRLINLVKRAGAATVQADIYLFRTRYGIADDLGFAEHFWSLVNNPVGRALVLRERGQQALEAEEKNLALKEFKRCYLLSARCGSHLTALKALIGLFHVGFPFREVRWQKHIDRLEGEQHVTFFNARTHYIAESGGFRLRRND